LTVGTAAATLLARVHQLAPASIGTFDTAVPGSSGNTPRLMIEHLHEFWIEKRTEALPLVELIFGWLRHNAPPSFRRSAVVHGDFAFHNLLVHQDRIEGLLDWEFCHHGDAQEDLAYTQRFVHQVMPWDDFRRAYEKAGGVESSPDELRFYSVLSHFRNALGCAGVLHALRTGSHEVDSKLVYVGRRYVHQMLTDAAKHTNAF
jgi:aminoglycoside phosphotransferase (APT) family kinase protein